MKKQEMVMIPRKEYELLLEEVGILNNKDMMKAIKESDEAKKKGIKPWKLKTHL
jgi:PHD/YefM family antitoxin component YafN of YafNO toxin-antitoxin module